MEKVVIAGGTGGIGKKLSKFLIDQLYDVTILTRNPNQYTSSSHLKFAFWDPEKKEVDAEVISNADYIINLAGENLNKGRWTKKKQQKILSSRVDSCSLIVNALKTMPNQVKAVISTSAIGWYGEDSPYHSQPFIEKDKQGGTFLSWVCKQWEDAIAPVQSTASRLVILRFGIVLSNNSGFFNKIKPLINKRIAPIMGNGKQMMSWIHEDDLCRMILFAIQKDDVKGIYNAVSSEPLSFKTFIKRCANFKFGHFYLPILIPAKIITILFGKKGKEMILTGTTVSNQKILQTGFKFLYPILNRECFEKLDN